MWHKFHDLDTDTIPTSLGDRQTFLVMDYWTLNELAIKHIDAPDNFNVLDYRQGEYRNNAYYIEELDWVWNNECNLDRSLQPDMTYIEDVIEAIQKGDASPDMVISELYRLGVLEDTKILMRVFW